MHLLRYWLSVSPGSLGVGALLIVLEALVGILNLLPVSGDSGDTDDDGAKYHPTLKQFIFGDRTYVVISSILLLT